MGRRRGWEDFVVKIGRGQGDARGHVRALVSPRKQGLERGAVGIEGTQLGAGDDIVQAL